MSWYKMARYISEWELIASLLKKELNREPSAKEIQDKMLEEDYSDKNKEVPVMASKWKDKLPGGNADKKTPSDYEKSQVERGKKVEFEHTDDPDTAREIAMDHLEEHGDYYVGLEHMEKCLKEIEDRAKKKNK